MWKLIPRDLYLELGNLGVPVLRWKKDFPNLQHIRKFDNDRAWSINWEEALEDYPDYFCWVDDDNEKANHV